MVLINSSSRDGMKIFQPFLPISVPLGAGYLVGVAEREGIRIELVDEQVEDDVIGMVKEHVGKMERPYIFGFSVLTAALKNSIIVSKRLKELYPDSVIIFGGVHPSAAPEDILSHSHIDLVVVGEGEKIIAELYRHIKGGKDFRHLENIAYMQNGKAVINPRASLIKNLDDLPPFPYHRFDKKAYDLGFVISSRGCPHQCIFCSNRIVTGKMYRFRSAESILEDLDIIHNKFKKKHVVFLDDNLLVNKDRIYTLLKEIRGKGLSEKMTFGFQARADNVDRELLLDLFNAGFKSIFFGIETASDRRMKVIKKGESVEDCRKAVRMSKEIGFQVSATFIYGLPGEAHEDRMDCVRLTRDLKIDMVRYNNATPYPGTELYEIAKREKRLYIKGAYENFNSVSVFIENPSNKIPFSYVPLHNTEKEIRMDILYSYLLFYFNIARMKEVFNKPNDLGWFNAGEGLMDKVRKIPGVLFLGLMMIMKFADLFLYMLFHSEKFKDIKFQKTA